MWLRAAGWTPMDTGSKKNHDKVRILDVAVEIRTSDPYKSEATPIEKN